MTQRPKIPQIFINADFTYADAKEAQSIFEAWLAEQKVFVTNSIGALWYQVGVNGTTDSTEGWAHAMYGVCPTELKPECVEHEPRAAFPFGSIPSDAEHIQWHCKHCGVKLKAKWEVE